MLHTLSSLWGIRFRVMHEARRRATLFLMSIHEDIKKGIPEAMKAKDEVTLRTYRSLVTAMTNEVVAKKRKPDEFLNDDEALAVLKRAANQRKDSIEQFDKAGRTELSEPEKLELAVIEKLLPAQMSREQVEAVVKAKKAEMPDANAGMLMSAIMKELKGQADGAIVKEVMESLG